MKVEEKDEVPSKLKIPHMPEKEKEDAPSSKLQWGDVLDVVEADVNAKKVEENEQKLDDKEKALLAAEMEVHTLNRWARQSFLFNFGKCKIHFLGECST